MGERLDPQKIRRVAIVVKPGLSEGYFERLVAALEKRGVEIAEVRHDDKPDGASEPELVFVLGGDGTMLRAIRMYPERVLLGVNLGKVGFMSGMLPDEIESGIEKVFSGGLEVQEYRMLDVRVDGGEPRLAANEAVLFKKRPHQLISVDVAVGGGGALRLPLRRLHRGHASRVYGLRALCGGPYHLGRRRLLRARPHSAARARQPAAGLGVDQVAELELVGPGGAALAGRGRAARDAGRPARWRSSCPKKSVRIGRTEDWSWWRAVRRTFL